MQKTPHQLVSANEMAALTGINPSVFSYWFKKGELKPDSTLLRGTQAYYFYNTSRIEELKQFHAHKKAIRYDSLRVDPAISLHKKRASSRERAKRVWRESPRLRLVHRLRCRLWKALTRSMGGNSPKTEKLVGCTVGELRRHIESQFKPGMTWETYGIGGWVIDHIRPCALFDLRKASQQRAYFHFSNLQPITDLENRQKGIRLLQPG